MSGAQDKSSNAAQLKVPLLQFLCVALRLETAKAWQPHLAQLVPPILAAAGERYYKVAAEAVRVCQALVAVLRPDLSKKLPAKLKVFVFPKRLSCAGLTGLNLRGQVQGLVKPLFECVAARMGAQDQDQEVKECAISASAAVIAGLGDLLGPQLPAQLMVSLSGQSLCLAHAAA